MTEFRYAPITQHSLWTHGIEDAEPTRETVPQLRERLERYGVVTLSNAELISIVFGTGQATPGVLRAAQEVVTSMSLPELLRVDFGELSRTLGDMKAAQFQAVMELARRLTRPPQPERYQIKSPADAAQLVRPDMAFLDHEELRVLYLDAKNGVVANIKLYQGTLNSSGLRAAEIFRPAITRTCLGILVCHNHPSGDPAPSPEDLDVTSQLVEAGKLLDIEVVDHVIIGSNARFVSLKEKLLW